MKVSPKIYRGIEYVVERDLPEDQQKRLNDSLPSVEFIKILLNDGTILDRCISFKEYSAWYDSLVTVVKEETVAKTPGQGIPVRIALNP
jgi:hypothetical protein